MNTVEVIMSYIAENPNDNMENINLILKIGNLIKSIENKGHYICIGPKDYNDLNYRKLANFLSKYLKLYIVGDKIIIEI